MQVKNIYFALVPCLLLAAGSANAAVFTGDSCAVLHAQSDVPREAKEALQDHTLNWQLSRAEYLRSLDYANLNTQYPKVDDYQEKRDLIESRYHLALAEAEVNEADDMKSGQSELKVTQCYVTRAMADADNHDLSQLKDIKNGLMKMSDSPLLNLSFFDDKQYALGQFHKIEHEVGSLL